MATQVQWRGGSTAEHATFTGAAREVTVDTQKKTLVVHDGSTAGGEPLLREDQANLPSSVTNGLYTPGTNQVALSTGGTGRLFVDANGHVGVGAAATANGTLRLNVAAGNNANLVFSENNTDRYIIGQVTGDNALRFYDLIAGSERLRITSAGLVGIGTSLPGYPLDVQSASLGAVANFQGTAANTYGTIRLTGNSRGGQLDFYNGATAQAAIWGNSSTLNFGVGPSSTQAMIIDSSGHVGIGTTVPPYRLTVKDTADQIHITNPTAGDANSDGFTIGLSGSDAQLVNRENGSIILYQNSGEAARIDDSKRLLVGTSTARTNLFGGGTGSQLQVEGTSFAQTTFSIVRNENISTSVPGIVLGKTRGSSNGANTVVQSGDGLGLIDFQGADGTNLVPAARISADVDGTPGANAMPGRIVLSTTSATPGASPTPRMTIKSTGIVNIANAPVYADNAAATAGGLVAGDVYRTATGQLMITY